MMRLSIPLVLAAVLATASPGSASHPIEDPDPCSGTVGGAYVAHDLTPVRVPTVGSVGVIPLADPARGPFYLDIRDVMSENHVVWIKLYQETNLMAGLQRWNGSPIWPDIPILYLSTDVCQGGTMPIRSSSDAMPFNSRLERTAVALRATRGRPVAGR